MTYYTIIMCIYIYIYVYIKLCPAWHGTARHGTVWYGVARRGVAWRGGRGVAWRGVAWCMASHGAWHGTARHSRNTQRGVERRRAHATRRPLHMVSSHGFRARNLKARASHPRAAAYPDVNKRPLKSSMLQRLGLFSRFKPSLC